MAAVIVVIIAGILDSYNDLGGFNLRAGFASAVTLSIILAIVSTISVWVGNSLKTSGDDPFWVAVFSGVLAITIYMFMIFAPAFS